VVFMIAHARGRERIRPSIRNSLALVAAGAAGGALVALLPVLAASGLPSRDRLLVAAVLAGGVLVASATRDRPWQFDVETPTQWLERPGAWPAVLNGLALGAGAVTRLGFWLAWLLPVLAFAVGGLRGLALGAVYGATRLGASAVLAWAPPGRLTLDRHAATRAASLALVLGTGYVATAAAVVVAG
jgi:hypothetical protein